MNPQLLSALQAEFAKSPSDLSKIGSILQSAMVT